MEVCENMVVGTVGDGSKGHCVVDSSSCVVSGGSESIVESAKFVHFGKVPINLLVGNGLVLQQITNARRSLWVEIFSL